MSEGEGEEENKPWKNLVVVLLHGIRQHEDTESKHGDLVWNTFGSHPGPGLHDGRLLTQIAAFAGFYRPSHKWQDKCEMLLNSAHPVDAIAFVKEQSRVHPSWGFPSNMSIYLSSEEVLTRLFCERCPREFASALFDEAWGRFARDTQSVATAAYLWCMAIGHIDIATKFLAPIVGLNEPKYMDWVATHLLMPRWSVSKFTTQQYETILRNMPKRHAAALKKRMTSCKVLRLQLSFICGWSSLDTMDEEIEWFKYLYAHRSNPQHPKWTNMLVAHLLFDNPEWSRNCIADKLVTPHSFRGDLDRLAQKYPHRTASKERLVAFLDHVAHPTTAKHARKHSKLVHKVMTKA